MTEGGIRNWRVLTLAIGLAVALPAQGQSRDTDALRAALVFNIIRFTDFNKSPGSPLLLCVDRGAASGSALMALEGQNAGGRAIAVRTADGAARECDVLYLGDATPSSIQRAQQPGLLLIGEGTGFIGKGGMVGLVQTGKQIRFEINIGVARRARLNISSQLLRLASRVQQ